MKRSRGNASVEFAVVGAVFLILFFGIFEMGRLLFLWNTLHESTRRGARVAVVCPVDDPIIIQRALFEDTNNNNTILPDMTAADFKLEYLDETGIALANPAQQYSSIHFVRLSVEPGTQISSSMPFLSQLITLPDFSTTLPAESLGISREVNNPQCSSGAN